MSEFAVIATGESMTADVAAGLNGASKIAINDAVFDFAADAIALCANDAAWWKEKGPRLNGFAGRRFSVAEVRGVERVKRNAWIESGTNSALIGLHVAITVFGARHVVLYGVDCHGSHYFGRHKALPNTAPHRFEVFKKQWTAYAKQLPKGIEVYNGSPASHLACFPFLR